MNSHPGRTFIRIIAVLLCLFSGVLSYHLLQKHWEQPKESAFSSMLDRGCTAIIAEANCDKVVKSEWGTLWGGIPTAQFGLYYYTILFWWFLLVGSASYGRRGIYLLVLSFMAVGLGFSIFLVSRMRAEHMWCTWCLFTHAANALLFICMLLVWPRPARAVAAPAPVTETTGLFQPAPVVVAAGEWPSGTVLLMLPVLILLCVALERPSPAVQQAVTHEDTKELHRQLEDAQHETETYKRLAQGNNANNEVIKLQEQLKDLQNERYEADRHYANMTELRDSEYASLQKQIDVLQKAAKGQADSSIVADLQQKLQTAEGLRRYWETLFHRYDNSWQQTYMAWLISPPLDIPIQNSPVRGSATATHTITLFSDFQCPVCKRFEEYLDERILPMVDRYGGMKIVFKNWPICTECNAATTINRHPNACEAAKAAQAAFVMGGNDKFWAMAKLLFANQETWVKTPNFDPYATQIGLDLAEFHKTMQSPAVLEKIKQDAADGANLSKDLLAQGVITQDEEEGIVVNSTPSVFVDSKRLASPQHMATWRMIMTLGSQPGQFFGTILKPKPTTTATHPG